MRFHRFQTERWRPTPQQPFNFLTSRQRWLAGNSVARWNTRNWRIPISGSLSVFNINHFASVCQTCDGVQVHWTFSRAREYVVEQRRDQTLRLPAPLGREDARPARKTNPGGQNWGGKVQDLKAPTRPVQRKTVFRGGETSFGGGAQIIALGYRPPATMEPRRTATKSSDGQRERCERANTSGRRNVARHKGLVLLPRAYLRSLASLPGVHLPPCPRAIYKRPGTGSCWWTGERCRGYTTASA